MNYLIYQYWHIFYENFKEMFDGIRTCEIEDYEIVLLGE